VGQTDVKTTNVIALTVCTVKKKKSKEKRRGKKRELLQAAMQSEERGKKNGMGGARGAVSFDNRLRPLTQKSPGAVGCEDATAFGPGEERGALPIQVVTSTEKN